MHFFSCPTTLSGYDNTCIFVVFGMLWGLCCAYKAFFYAYTKKNAIIFTKLSTKSSTFAYSKLNISKMKQIVPYLLFFSCLLNWQNSFAGNDKNSLGARAGALGGASVTFADAFSVFANQAGLAQAQSLQIGLFAENRFLLKDLSSYSLGVAIPVQKVGAFGVGVNYFGNAAFNQQQISLGYGRLLFEKLSMGVSFDVHNYSIAEYGSKAIFSFGIGLRYNLNAKLAIGAQVSNPLRQQLTEDREDIAPSIIKLGGAFTPSDRVTFLVEAEKNIDRNMQFKAGIEYRPIDMLYLRGGISTEPNSFSAGIGCQLNPITIDLATSFHPVLGYIPQSSIIFKGKNKATASTPQDPKK